MRKIILVQLAIAGKRKEVTVLFKKGRSNPRIWGYLGGSVLAAAALLASAPVAASLCASTTSCTLALTQGNTSSGFGTGNFGTVDLKLSGDTVTITIALATGWQIVNTGFPGSFGFSDSLGGGLTIGGFSSALYSGALSDATNDLHFDGFGYVNDAAATSGPHAGNGLQSVSFTVSKGTSITDVNQLLNGANPAGGDGAAVFIVDAFNGINTGLLTGTTVQKDVPEPATLALLCVGLIGFGISRRRR
jgi:hypothetical protein